MQRFLFRAGEEDGKAYHFVSRENMELAIGKGSRKKRCILNLYRLSYSMSK